MLHVSPFVTVVTICYNCYHMLHVSPFVTVVTICYTCYHFMCYHLLHALRVKGVTICYTCYHLLQVLRIDISALPGETAVDTAVRLCYTPVHVRHLLVVTSSNRLLKLDARTGRLLTEIGNIHRQTCSGVAVSGDGKYLTSCGDRVVKIWDYAMRLDLNFQVNVVFFLFFDQ